jgi:hypothetical protein
MSKKPTLRVVDDAGLWIAGPDPLTDDFDSIEVAKPKAADKEDKFAQISLRAAAEVSEKMGSADFVILVLLAFKAFDKKGRPFELSNDLLPNGVHREAKRRALTRLENTGVIRLERRRGKAPIVTLLVKFR